ncbi:MAG: VWA domain-containing protein [Thermoanaerobaculia bacterium]
MNFAEPGLLWLTAASPLGALVAWWLLRRRAAAESAWASRAVEPRLRPVERPRRRAAIYLLVGLSLLGTALALARPRWGESVETVEQRGVDIVFVLDSSASMAAYDVTPSRLWLAASLIRRMAEALPGNRVALVQAEGVGVVISPLTVDSAVLDLLLDAVEPGSLPVPGSHLGPAIQRAVTLFPAGAEKQRVMIVLSDGEIHGEELAPTIERLRTAGVVLHAVGIGTETGAPVPVAGRPNEFKRTAEGQIVVSRLDSAPLEALADATGGIYLSATSATANPSAIVGRILDMEKRGLSSSTLSTLQERFQWPLAAALLALLLRLVATPFRRLRRPSEVAA